MSLEKVKALIRGAGIVSPSEFKPCSEKEVQQLEQGLGFLLPEVYREFLLWMGHGAGRFLRGSDFHCEELLSLQNEAKLLLQENNFPEALPTDAFVFFMHQGYLFYFLRIKQEGTSPIYGYCEGNEKTDFSILYNSFEDFLFAIAEDHITLAKRSSKI